MQWDAAGRPARSAVAAFGWQAVQASENAACRLWLNWMGCSGALTDAAHVHSGPAASAKRTRALWEGEGNQRVTDVLIVFVAAAGRDHDELFAGLLALKCHRRGVRARGQSGHPKFLTGVLFACPETSVIRGADEHQPAGRHDAAS